MVEKLLNTRGWIFGACLLLQLKFWNVRGASHLWALLVTRFIVLSTQWMKEMRTWGWSEITNYCFFVFIYCYGIKFGAGGEYLMRFVSANMTDLGMRLKCQQGDTSWVWYYLCSVAGWPRFPYIRGLMLARQDQTAEIQVRFPGGQNTNREFFWNRKIFVKDQWWYLFIYLFIYSFIYLFRLCLMLANYKLI